MANYKIDWNDTSTFKVSRGYTYEYKYLAAPSTAKAGTPVLLMLHGFPEEPEVFDDLAHYLHIEHAIGVLIPSLLGYKGTSKPDDPAEYNFEGQTQDLVDICAHENISSIISVGRDWGSVLSQRFPLYRPEITKAAIIMCVQYFPPDILPRNETEDLDRFVKACRAKYSIDYDNYNYFKYFTTDECNESWDKKIRSTFRFLAAGQFEKTAFDGTKMRDSFREAVEPSEAEPLKGMEKWFVARWSKDSFKGPFNWYKCLCRGFQRQSEEKQAFFKTGRIEVPVLFIAGGKDLACPFSGSENQGMYISDIRNVCLANAGHALHRDDPQGLREATRLWLQDKNFINPI